jgi:hypothetical protein
MFKSFFRLAVLLTPLLAEADSKLWDATNHAYGFLLAQKITNQIVERNFPALAASSAEANNNFLSSPYGKSFDSIEKQIAAGNPANWLATKEQIYETVVEALEQKIKTESDAEDFIGFVNARSKGRIDPPIRNAILANNPDFHSDFSKEIDNGLFQEVDILQQFEDSGSVSLLFPLSWEKQISDETGSISYKGMSGREIIDLKIFVKQINIPKGLDARSLSKEFFSPASLETMAPPQERLLSTSSVDFNNRHWGKMVSEVSSSKLNPPVKMRLIKYFTLHKRFLITFRFMLIKTPISEDSLDSAQSRIEAGAEGVLSTIKFKN